MHFIGCGRKKTYCWPYQSPKISDNNSIHADNQKNSTNLTVYYPNLLKSCESKFEILGLLEKWRFYWLWQNFHGSFLKRPKQVIATHTGWQPEETYDQPPYGRIVGVGSYMSYIVHRHWSGVINGYPFLIHWLELWLHSSSWNNNSLE